jgi:hypothetical protein
MPNVNWEIIVINDIDCQILGDINNSVKSNMLTALTPFVDYLASLEKEGTTISMDDLFAIKIISQNSIMFSPNRNTTNNQPQLFQWESIDTSYVEALAADILSNLA